MHPVPHILVRAMTHSRSGSRYYRPRAMSLENPKLLEALTIYEKLKKCQEETENDEIINDLSSGVDPGGLFSPHCDGQIPRYGGGAAEEPVPLEPFVPCFSTNGDMRMGEAFAYCKYKDINLQDTNYLYFSSSAGLIQAKTLEGLCEEEEELHFTDLLLAKKYWLDVVDPTEEDLQLLSSSFQVHELTIRDIKEGHSEEKIEMYNHYTFVSLKLMKENSTSSSSTLEKFPKKTKKNRSDSSSTAEECECFNIDIDSDTTTTTTQSSSSDEETYLPCMGDFAESSESDLNILIFSDFIITIHKKPWENVKEILGFLSVIHDYGDATPPLPEWVLFSIFVELSQSAKQVIKTLTPKILSMRAAQVNQEEEGGGGGIGVDVLKLSTILRRNLMFEFDLHKVTRFLKPKLAVLRSIQLKGRRRFPNVKFLANVGSELDEMLDDLDNLSRIVERSQDTFLALASVQQSVEANEMGMIMKRISEIAMIFLPVQAIAGFLGMNVKVPFQEEESTLPFWTIVLGSIIIAASLFLGKRLILRRHKFNQLSLKKFKKLKKK